MAIKVNVEQKTIVRTEMTIILDEDDIRQLHEDLYDIGSNLELRDYPKAFVLYEVLQEAVQNL